MLSVVLALCLAVPPPPLLEVKERVPSLEVDLRYATAANFMKTQVYPTGARCLLIAPALEKLKAAAAGLKAKGFHLRAFDCYRPLSVQRKMWEVFPQRGYVADPNKGGSHHNRGAAVDVTLVAADGTELEMGTPFDSFSHDAWHSSQKVSARAQKNRRALLEAMEGAGFQRNPMEWWHYELPDALSYPLRDESVVVGFLSPSQP